MGLVVPNILIGYSAANVVLINFRELVPMIDSCAAHLKFKGYSTDLKIRINESQWSDIVGLDTTVNCNQFIPIEVEVKTRKQLKYIFNYYYACFWGS